MKNKIINIRIIELFVFVVVWIAVFSVPFFNQRMENTVDWSKVTREWITMLSLLIVFTLNTLVLVPRFLFQKKYTVFIVLVFILIMAVVGITIILQMRLLPEQPLQMPPMELGPGMPPMELGPGMPAPLGYKPQAVPVPKSLFMIFIDNFLLSFLVIGVGTAIKMVSQWLNEESKRKDLEKEQLKTELALLRHQVSPHFFMNTLNNIHALIDINPDDAKNSIIQLSTMMRYLLYDTAHGQTTLKKEIAFIESYIALMKLRFSQKVEISLLMPEYIKDIQIPPMLFISFLENAFKHGVGYNFDSYVSLKLEQSDKSLKCIIRNSKVEGNENADNTYSGIGMANIKKSLQLLYGDEYLLEIIENEKEFEVQLTISI